MQESMSQINFKIFSVDDFDINNIILKSPIPRTNKSSTREIIPVLYNDPHYPHQIPIIIRTPDIFSPEDLTTTENPKFPNEISIPLVCMTEKHTNNLKELFYGLDNRFINEGKNKNIKNVSKYKFIVEQPIDNGECHDNIYNDGIVKFKCINTPKFKTRFFDGNKNQLNPSEPVDLSGRAIQLIFEIDCIWVNDEGVYGINTKLHQVLLSGEVEMEESDDIQNQNQNQNRFDMEYYSNSDEPL